MGQAQQQNEPAADTAPAPELDEAFLREVLEHADLNVLRVALYQQTRDPELAAMGLETVIRPGNPFTYSVVTERDRVAVKDKAIAYLLQGDRGRGVIPSKAEAAAMMEMFVGESLSTADIDFGWEDLAFEGFPRGAAWAARPAQGVLDSIFVTIVGAGFSGLLAAIQLDRLGLKYRIIERQAGIGGTWFLNSYPEARVDVTSFLYQFKFERDYAWKSFFATQAELQEYLEYIVDKYDLRKHITLNAKVARADWAEPEQRWKLRVEHDDGTVEHLDSDFVISASGQFSTPRTADIKGASDYRGALFHTTAWDHGFDYAGKRVAVIGNGSTGSQLLRGVAEKAASVTVYQRTPNWVSRAPNYRDPVPAQKRWLLDNMPGYANWYIYSLNAAQTQMDGLHDLDPIWRAKGGLVNEKNDHLRERLKRYIRSKVGDNDDLYQKLTPSYAPLARRLVTDNEWYDTLLRDNVELVTGEIERFTETGILSPDGQERAFDLIVLSSGFDVERFLWPVEYTGRGGAKLGDLWEKDGARAYLTLALPGFPNFIMMYGPNAGILSGSFHSWIENYSRYFSKLITATIESGARTFEVRREAFDRYNQRLDERLRTKLWESENGGGGYYINGHGRPGVSMPWTLQELHTMLRAPDLDEFILS